MIGSAWNTTRRAAEDAHEHLVLFDLALDYGTTPRLGLARADQCGTGAFRTVCATLGLAGLRWKFKAPVKIGDTIRVRARVVAKRESGQADRGLVVLQRTVLNQRGEVVQEGETDVMVERRR